MYFPQKQETFTDTRITKLYLNAHSCRSYLHIFLPPSLPFFLPPSLPPFNLTSIFLTAYHSTLFILPPFHPLHTLHRSYIPLPHSSSSFLCLVLSFHFSVSIFLFLSLSFSLSLYLSFQSLSLSLSLSLFLSLSPSLPPLHPESTLATIPTASNRSRSKSFFSVGRPMSKPPAAV